MSFYFNLTLGKMCFNSPKSVVRVWIKYTMTAILLKEIIEKVFHLGASVAHYILATSLILKFLSLISKWHWKWSACFGHVPVCHSSCWWCAISECFGSVLSKSPVALIWCFHIAWAGSCFSFLSKDIHFAFSGSRHHGCAHHPGYLGHSELGSLQSFQDLNSGCSVDITPIDWLGLL